MRIGFFTAGTTGAGHLVRALAIQRALARESSHAEYVVFAPPIPFQMGAAVPAGLVREVTIDHAELRDPARAAESALATALRAFAPDVLLVDLFWAPLLHILPVLACEAWLLLRSVPEAWFAGPRDHAYDRGQYARVLAIEPGAAARSADETIEPVVISNPGDLRPRGALREAIGASTEPLVVVHQAGERGEWSTLVERVARSSVHVFTFARADVEIAPRPGVQFHDGGPFFPLGEWLGDADVIASGAGYNAYWEARWLGHAARSRFTPFVRQIDDQAWRLRTCGGHEMRANGADVLARMLR